MQSLGARRHSKEIYLLVSLIAVLVAGILIFFIDIVRDNERIDEEINRLSTYFEEEGTFRIYKRPRGVEWAPAIVSVDKLRHISYLLQSEDDMKKTYTYSDGRTVPILTGKTLYPFETKKKALKHYNKLTDAEKEKYYIVSHSIVYIGSCSVEELEVLKMAASYLSCSL